MSGVHQCFRCVWERGEEDREEGAKLSLPIKDHWSVKKKKYSMCVRAPPFSCRARSGKLNAFARR